MIVNVGYLSQATREAQAEAKGCRIVYPKPNELQLDIDSDEDFERFKSMSVYEKIADKIGISHIRVTPSPSGEPGHYHVTIDLKEDVESSWHRIFLQAVLGSDPVRELLAWQRMQNGEDQPSCFFEKPNADTSGPEMW